MNFFGIGTLEVLVILMVALIALGPSKTVDVARTIGRMTREARRTFTEIMDAASVEERPGYREDQERRPRQSAPPDEPLAAPPNLAEQTRASPESGNTPGPDTNRPPDDR